MTEEEIRSVLQSRSKPKAENRRRSPSKRDRTAIFAKTSGTCHVCGRVLGIRWQADHIRPHAYGGSSSLENYLPICGECNRLRWSYAPDVIRLIMHLGVYAKDEIRRSTPLGRALTKLAAKRGQTRTGRRRV